MYGSKIRKTARLAGMVLALGSPLASMAQTYSKTEVIEYHDDLANWVLGQQKKLTVNGIAASETTFNAKAQPEAIKSFGELQQTITYAADGTVSTIRDGNNNVTTLSNWKRGIPQLISHAGGSIESAVVNNNGWLTSVSDENGYATAYTYDVMGRLTGITPPTGDMVAWNSTALVFEAVASAEYGIPAGHWRQTATTGNARRVTYFDALWRPLLTREYDAANEAGTTRFQRFAYDEEGRVVFTSYPGATDALSTGTWTTYDALGRATSVSQDSEQGLLTTTTEYLSGFKTRVTNPRGQQITTSYQAYEQPSYDLPTLLEVQGGAATAIPRDVFGKPVSISRY
jgi:YD repeat-containing protein